MEAIAKDGYRMQTLITEIVTTILSLINESRGTTRILVP